MTPVYIGLGSNLSGSKQHPSQHLESALKTINKSSKIDNLSYSSFYRSRPIGPQDQPDYINAVATFKTSLSPIQLLDYLQDIETSHGRVRTERWGARTLDLDILFYGNLTIDSDRLTVPHPRLGERAFVLAPLLEISPNFRLENGISGADLLANCGDQGIVKLKQKHLKARE